MAVRAAGLVLLLACAVAAQSPPPSVDFVCPTVSGSKLSPVKDASRAFPKICTHCQREADRLKKWPALPPMNVLDPAYNMRSHVLRTANCFVGSVSACGGSGGQMFGSNVLVDIYKTSFDKQYKTPWTSDIAKVKSSAWKTAHGGPWSWCGIYALGMVKYAVKTCLTMKPVPAWCDKKLETVMWGSPGGPQSLGTQIPAVNGNTQPVCRGGNYPPMQPGDIVVFKGALQHHALVWAVEGNDIITMDGNVWCEGIYPVKRSRCEIQGYYSLTNAGVKPDKYFKGKCSWAKENQVSSCKSTAAAPPSTPRAGPGAPPAPANGRGPQPATPPASGKPTTVGRVTNVLNGRTRS